MGEHLAGKEQRRRIWIVFTIMAVITAAEFVIAFTVGRGVTRNVIFILMTLAKAFYIVAEFMHLKHEVRGLILTISLPCIFLLWFILACLIEGDWYNGGWFRFLLG